jgi:phospholipid/cholesterol/gamma-HCH transport system substrate-binding protein
MSTDPHSQPEVSATAAASQSQPAYDPLKPIAHLQLKALLLLALMITLVTGAVLYLMYARGVFEAKQALVLVADDSEGVVVGMDVTFSGFPIGRISRIELSKEGNARMIVDVPLKDAGWLRESSIFTMEKGLVGAPKIRAFSGILTDPPLKDGAVRNLLVGDASAEIPRLVASIKELTRNLTAMTAADSDISATLANVKSVTDKLKGPQGAIGVLMGNEADAKKLVEALERTNTLLAKVDGLALKANSLVSRVDGVVAKADTQVFGEKGVMRDAQATVQQLNAVLTDVRGSMKKVDAVLAEAQAVGANARVATTDLGVLRADVEASLRKVDSLVNDINRKWPFARDAEIKLP